MSEIVYCRKVFIESLLLQQRKEDLNKALFEKKKVSVAALSKLNKCPIKPEQTLIQSLLVSHTNCVTFYFEMLYSLFVKHRGEISLPSRDSLLSQFRGQMEGTYCSLMKVTVYWPSCGEKG